MDPRQPPPSTSGETAPADDGADLAHRVARLEASNRKLVLVVGLLAGIVMGLVLARVFDEVRDRTSAAPDGSEAATRLALHAAGPAGRSRPGPVRPPALSFPGSGADRV